MADKKDEGLKLLKDIRKIEYLISKVEEEYERTYAKLTSTTVKAKDVNVQSSGNPDPMADGIIEVVEYEKQLKEYLDDLCSKKKIVILVLQQMESEQQLMLTMRYIEGKTIEEVGEELNRSSYYHTWETLHKAEEDFCILYANRVWKGI